MRNWIRVFFDAEGTPGGGDGGNGEPEGGVHGGEGEQLEKPKYFSQLTPEKADGEDYKRLYKYPKLDDLANAAITFESENERLKKEHERAIIVPDGKDPEAVKKFALALGVPENHTEYAIAALDDKSGISPESLDGIKKMCHKYMMTGRQADAVGKILVSVAQDGARTAAKILEQRRTGIGATLQASYADLQSDIDRKTSAERDMAAYKAFAKETGLVELFEQNGVAYNPQVIKAIAAFSRTHAGQSHAVPSSQLTESRPNTGYGKEFADKYGGR